MKLSIGFAALSLLVGSCASVPPVVYQYSPAMGVVTISVVQALACTTDQTRLIISNTQPTVNVSYQASTDGKPWSVSVAAGSEAANADFTLTRWDDGRLKSINSVSTGQGSTIAKDLVTFGGALATVVGEIPAPTAPPPPVLKICTELKLLNKDSVVSITYSDQFRLADLTDSPQFIKAAALSADLFDQLKGLQHIGPMSVSMTQKAYDTKPAIHQVSAGDRNDYFWLKLQSVRFGELRVSDQKGAAMSTTQVLIPSTDDQQAWELPIPKSRAFGKSTFALSVSESGLVTSVEYARETGVPGALEAAGSGLSAFAPSSASEKLSALKTQDDLIAENNRHALCLAQPENCK